MKFRIFGRKRGATAAMVRLIESDEPTADGGPADSGVVEAFTVANARRAAQVLRGQGIEGYVLFSDDPTPYAFAPDADFVYPAVRH
ncbi:hypothetical protein DF016_10890 [Burkholderia stagnalis]|uniref:Uncharacterized protein n=1 Tax=Burkholderia stagnalis TaxID=1503054 RepID=A0ABX9YRK0_9BURK|nr:MULTISPECIES: hypothetical protein [Burkholderia]MDD1494059.1 hypothetical protein [Burkholderia thailandensis]RQY93835.1 hypothetical protein DF017_12470 [Burkholderia stagnalis]RQZ19557.1 hypothetical protein DF016_10890 [Burkholderia stagnalis]